MFAVRIKIGLPIDRYRGPQTLILNGLRNRI